MVFWITALLVFIADQITKYAIVSSFALGESVAVISKGLHFTYVINTGAAFGILPGGFWFFIVFTAIVLAGIVYYQVVYRPKAMMQAIFGLIAGGALGNFTDRLFRAGVVDFIDLGWWPVFNLADSAICCGAVALLIFTIREERKEAADGAH
jgi:signal peptidase II